ncbi:MAG: glycosyltransferase family 4 protein [Zoogloeaceae bacterium]|nr:glycosyltransferase family 4 protein [Rhodocyclaceae bacterium]MCP5237937.1 glycosyltransferase family 4 protein [Zoogloeaceae bacterium]
MPQDIASATGASTDPPLRLLLLTTSYPVAGQSVSGAFVERLANALAEQVRVTVLTPDAATPPERRPRSALTLTTFRYAPRRHQRLAHGPGGIPAALRAGWRQRLLVLPFLLAMFAATWRHASQHQAILANWSVCGLIAGIVGRLQRRPVVTVMRGEDVARLAGSALFRAIARACLRQSRSVVTVSDAMAEQLRSFDPAHADKVRMIANGVSDDFLAVPEVDTAATPLRLLYVGSLIPRKSVVTLVEAMCRLSEDVLLTIVGEGSEAAALVARSVAAGLDRRVRFLPFHPSDQIASLLADAHALVLPSLSEGRPNVVIEALAAGRPAIVSDIPGSRELVGDDQRGLRFPAGDAAALADCIDRLRDPTLRRRLGNHGRQFIHEQGLSWTAAAREYRRLFEPTERC